MNQPEGIIKIVVTEDLAGLRIDKALVDVLSPFSRSVIQQWIKRGLVILNGQTTQPKEKLVIGDNVIINIPPLKEADWPMQPLEVEVVYQDEDIMVIDKAAGMVVHPGAGNPDRTLLNGILHIDPSLRKLPRAGIVHRLDKDTSGLMVVARNEQARLHLIEQLKARSMHREYIACVVGRMIAGGSINQPIGRNRRDRLKMAVVSHGKPAITHYIVVERFARHTLIRAKLESGRTHQIRVHLAWRGYPLVGDPLYGGRIVVPPDADSTLIERLRSFPRQALHACELSLIHPNSGKLMNWRSPLATDIAELLDLLRKQT